MYMKNLFSRALVALSFFVWFSCDSKEVKDTPQGRTDTVVIGNDTITAFFESVDSTGIPEPVDGEIVLRFNPQKGKKYTTKMNTVTKIRQSVLDQSFSSNMDISTTNSITVNDNRGGEQITLTSKVHAFKAMMKQDTMVAGFENGKPADDPEIDMMRKILDCYIDMPIQITMDKNADVISIDGIQKVQDKIAAELGEDAVYASMQMSDMNQEVVNSFVAFPPKPVKVGDTWTTTDSVDMGGFPSIMENTFTLTSFDDTYAWVSVNSSFKIDRKTMQELGATGDEVTMSGYQKGTMKVEKSSGWSMASDLSQKLQLKMENQGQTMSIQIDGSSSLITTKE
jgi:hypothetical protein